MISRKSLINGGLTAAFVGAMAGLSTISPLPRASASGGDAYADLPAAIVLTGVVRDFKEVSVAGGHADFEVVPAGGYGHYMGNIASMLDSDKKPVFAGGGRKVTTQWKTSTGVQISPIIYSATLGDRAGAYASGTDKGGIASANSFGQWYRDVPGTNMSKSQAITLKRQSGTNMYVFDDRSDALYQTRGGFFPINAELFGNSRNETKNFHFTYELSTEFTYKPATNQTFTFIGDDDVWVFINDKLAIDIGGIHSAVTQTVYLDRLTNLVANGRNTLRVFQAERHRTQSNFRIETTINLKNAELPSTSHLYD